MVGRLQDHLRSLADGLRHEIGLQVQRRLRVGQRRLDPGEVRRLAFPARGLPELRGAQEVALADRDPGHPGEGLAAVEDRQFEPAEDEEPGVVDDALIGGEQGAAGALRLRHRFPCRRRGHREEPGPVLVECAAGLADEAAHASGPWAEGRSVFVGTRDSLEHVDVRCFIAELLVEGTRSRVVAEDVQADAREAARARFALERGKSFAGVAAPLVLRVDADVVDIGDPFRPPAPGPRTRACRRRRSPRPREV